MADPKILAVSPMELRGNLSGQIIDLMLEISDCISGGVRGKEIRETELTSDLCELSEFITSEHGTSLVPFLHRVICEWRGEEHDECRSLDDIRQAAEELERKFQRLFRDIENVPFETLKELQNFLGILHRDVCADELSRFCPRF